MPNPDRWTDPPATFNYILFERVNPEENENRFYLIAWQQTLLGPGIVRIWGRKAHSQRLAVEPFASLAAAWPTIRAHIRARLRHNYQIVEESL